MDQTYRFLQQENARLTSELDRLRNRMYWLGDSGEALDRLSSAISHLTTEDDLIPLLEKSLYHALSLMDAEEGSIILLDEDTNELVFTVVRSAIESNLVNFRLPREEGIIGWAANNAKPALVNDVKSDDRFSPRVDELFGYETKSLLATPLLTAQGVIGVLCVVNKLEDAEFDEIDQSILAILSHVAAFALTQFEESA